MSNFIFRKKETETHRKYYFLGIQIASRKKDKHQNETPSSLYLEPYLRLIPQNFLNLLVINIVEHCNLNCKNCSHFSSIAEKEFLDIKTYRNDIKRVYELTEDRPYLIPNIQLQGGEPLLHPQLTEFFATTREYFPDSDLIMVTNAILLNQQKEEFWLDCHKYNVKIAPTVYPLNIKWDEIDEKAQKYDVLVDYGYVVGETIKGKPETLKTSWHWPMDLNGNKMPISNFSRCNLGNNCVSLSYGRIFPCILPTGIKHFNKYFNKNLKVTEADSIDIYKAKNLKEVLDFVSKPFPFCRYCDVDNRTFGHEWGYHTNIRGEAMPFSDSDIEDSSNNKISIKEWTL